MTAARPGGRQLRIRQERPDDYGPVYDLIAAAFASAEHRDGDEPDLVVRLRKSAAFIPALSLVAEVDGALAGHILFTEARVGAETVLALAPLSVRPELQRQGIGTALIAEGHRLAKALGYAYSVVLGSERYYPRMGYVPAARLGVETPAGMPPENFMAVRLREDAAPLRGPMVYAREFGLEG